MKKILFAVLFLSGIVANAQTEKTLLWEISGNGLSKNSYLYGTMHVNEKISYHLTDSFYKHLLEADVVSNESNPDTWDRLIDILTNNKYDNADLKFYNTFNFKPIKKEDLTPLFSNINIYNSMISGNNSEQADYQENTVLDMFIHQTGKKYNKNVTGLEDAIDSFKKITKISQDYTEPKEETKIALTKLLKNKNYQLALNDFYREKDIVMLDSLYKLIYPKTTHDVMINNRNVVMAKSIDSLAKSGSLFAAIGAAHLAGKNGVIQLLINKGYTVKPVFDELTAVGEKQKKTIEDYFPSPELSNFSTKDGILKMPLYINPLTIKDATACIDMTNGGSININRIALNDFLKKKNEVFNHKTLDSLFFENIPGTIIEKKFFETENYRGYDIRNKTKALNFQHYRFYITPLEIIGVSMTGNGEYVKQYENQIFDKIEVKSLQNSWDKFNPIKGGFSVEIPSYSTIHGNEIDKIENNITIQSFDKSENAYYFLEEKTMTGTSYLENTAFENKQIQEEFFMQNDIDSNEYNDATNESAAKIDDKKIRLKTFIKGTKYFLLGSVNASDKNTDKFFNSFKIVPNNQIDKYAVLNDTISKFKVEIPSKINEKTFLALDKSDYKNKNAFLSKYKTYNFYSNSGNEISLEYNKFHKYESFENIDSLKTFFFKNYVKDYTSNHYANDIYDDYDDYEYRDYDRYSGNNPISLLTKKLFYKKGFTPSKWNELMADNDKYYFISKNYSFDKQNNTHIIEAVVSKPNATQAIKYKTLIKESSYYELQSLVDKAYKNDDAFIEKTYSTFEPTDTDSTSVFDDKFNLFLNDVYSKKDTIRFSAIQSINELKISNKDFDSATQFLNTFKFKESENLAISNLLLKIGSLKDERVIPYLEQKYKDEKTKTNVQIAIIKALTQQKSKAGYQKIIDLLEYDLPITDKQYDVTSMFTLFKNDLENSKELFPKIFQFYSIKEYNNPTLELCNLLFDKDLISPKKISSFKKMILTNAKLEYKRVVSWNEKNSKIDQEEQNNEDAIEETTNVVEEVVDAVNSEEDEENNVEENAPVDDLINYIDLLYNFQSDKDTDLLFKKIEILNIPELNIELLRLGIINDKTTKEKIEQVLSEPKTKFSAIQLLLYKDKYNLLSSISDDEIAEAAIRNFENIKPKDSISFLEKRIEMKNNKKICFYFYKMVTKKNYDNVTKKLIYPIAFLMDKNKINPMAYNEFYEKEIEDGDDIKKKIDAIVNESLNEEHLRATFEKEKIENFNLYNDY